MWEDVFSIALSNGIFACLFVCLLIYELKDSRTREKKYQNTINSLTSRLSCVEKVKDDVEEIKQTVIYKKEKRSSEKN